MSVIRTTVPPRCAGGVCMITPSGTGSCVPSFDAGAALVVHKPVRAAAPGATAAVGDRVPERLNARRGAWTPVTILRTLPGIACSPSRLLQGQLHELVGSRPPCAIAAGGGGAPRPGRGGCGRPT